MKVQLVYDRPAQAPVDILLVVLDEGYKLHDVSGSAIEEVVARVQKDFNDKRLKTDYFAPLEIKNGPRHLLICSTSLNKSDRKSTRLNSSH